MIWANHNMRASVHAMQQTTKEIYDKTSLATLEAGEGPVQIVPVSEVFRIQNTSELKEAENKYDNPTAVAERMGEIPQ